MLGNWNVEWLNLNSQRCYPLADDADGVDQTGVFVLPKDFLVAMDIPVHAGMVTEPGKFFLRTLAVFATGFSLTIGYDAVTGPINVATALIPVNGHTPNSAYALGGVSPFDDTVGKVTIGNLDSILQQPPGFYTFNVLSSRLDPDVIRPLLRGVSSLTVVNGSQRSQPIYGDIELVAGANFRIIPTLVAGQNPQIRLDAIAGEGLLDDCLCDPTPNQPIYTINRIRPTADGDFFLQGGTCVEVAPLTNGLRLNNPCSQPCLGCPDLEALTAQLESLKAQSAAVADFVRRTDTLATALSTTVLGARLRDDGCDTC